MRPIGAIAILLPLLAAAEPAAAQRAGLFPGEGFGALARPVVDMPLARGEEGLSFRIDEQMVPDGSWELRRGIIAGFEVTPGALLGIGLFETLPKRVVRSEESALDRPNKSRKAAVGLKFRF